MPITNNFFLIHNHLYFLHSYHLSKLNHYKPAIIKIKWNLSPYSFQKPYQTPAVNPPTTCVNFTSSQHSGKTHPQPIQCTSTSIVYCRYLVHLDEKTMKTPYRHTLAVPSKALALMIANEFNRQDKLLKTIEMPMLSLSRTAVDADV